MDAYALACDQMYALTDVLKAAGLLVMCALAEEIPGLPNVPRALHWNPGRCVEQTHECVCAPMLAVEKKNTNVLQFGITGAHQGAID